MRTLAADPARAARRGARRRGARPRCARARGGRCSRLRASRARAPLLRLRLRAAPWARLWGRLLRLLRPITRVGVQHVSRLF
jgi:hypothetical protein